MKLEKISIDDKLYKKAVALRYELFFKEHNLAPETVFDEKESSSIHVAAHHGGDLIAYGRLTEIQTGCYQISQMVVSQSFQSLGYGSQLLGALVTMAFDKGAQSISLNARITAVGLYEKQGFVKAGTVFHSASTGVPHIKMVRSVNT